MSHKKHDPSVYAEPHLSNESPTPDPAERRAQQRLASERVGTDPEEERAKHSVFDEPSTRPNRTSVLIERDWSCRNCGYNLRGLMTGHPCPECGKIELYEPPREGELTYLDWLAANHPLPSLWTTWFAAILMPLPAIPLAIGCAFYSVEYMGLMSFVLVGPALSELCKVAIAATLIERRSVLIRSAEQIGCMTIATALMFAIVQNMICLRLFFKNAPLDLVLYRWVVCVLLHVVCTVVATRGLTAVWRRVQHEHRQFSIAAAFPAVAVAIIIHAVYNASVFFSGNLGYGF